MRNASACRLNVYKQFKEGQKRILVATDLVGRGIDIERVNIVINYDMPETDDKHGNGADTYLHRVSLFSKQLKKFFMCFLVYWPMLTNPPSLTYRRCSPKKYDISRSDICNIILFNLSAGCLHYRGLSSKHQVQYCHLPRIFTGFCSCRWAEQVGLVPRGWPSHSLPQKPTRWCSIKSRSVLTSTSSLFQTR